MNILAILSRFGLSHATLFAPVSELFCEIVRKGHEVNVIALVPGQKGIKFSRRFLGNGILRIWAVGRLKSRIARLFQFLHILVLGVLIVRRYRINIIYSHILERLGLAANLIGSIVRIPHAHWICGMIQQLYPQVSFLQKIIQYFPLRIVLNRCDCIITCTRATRKDFADFLKLKFSKFRIIPNSVSLDRFNLQISGLAVRDRFNLHDKRVILFVHRLSSRKGPEFLIKALPIVYSEIPDVKCLIVGNGPQKKYLEYLSKQIRIADQTIFVGKVPSKDLPQFYSACDVFVMPSVVEGFGRVLIEAMASERPIVTTKTGGVPEVATEGESAILVPIKDPKALANAIIMILNDKKMALKLAQNGRRRAVNFYSHKHVAQLYLDVFKELCLEQLGSRSF